MNFGVWPTRSKRPAKDSCARRLRKSVEAGGGGVVGEAADEEATEVRAHGGRVVGHEGIGGVLAGEGDERDLASRVVAQPRRDVLDAPGDGDPEVVRGGVHLQLIDRDHADVNGVLGGGQHCVGVWHCSVREARAGHRWRGFSCSMRRGGQKGGRRRGKGRSDEADKRGYAIIYA
ncbi:hypothetical protein ZWY2020_046581 [Hordeum vulgare]|nr:hypothetical protein ZWY2020_046581 [Hordeum vulgare]